MFLVVPACFQLLQHLMVMFIVSIFLNLSLNASETILWLPSYFYTVQLSCSINTAMALKYEREDNSDIHGSLNIDCYVNLQLYILFKEVFVDFCSYFISVVAHAYQANGKI